MHNVGAHLHGHVCTCNTYECTSHDGQNRQRRAPPPSFQSRDTAVEVVCVVQPEKPSQAIRVPGREHRSSDSNKIAENRDRSREDERDCDGEETQADPCRPPEERVGVHMSRVAEESQQYQLGCGVCVQSPGAGAEFSHAVWAASRGLTSRSFRDRPRR